MTFKIMPEIETREEFIALFDAVAGAVADDSEREQQMFAAFTACADRLLECVEPDELERILAGLAVSLPRLKRRNKRG